MRALTLASLLVGATLGCSKETRISEIEPNTGTFSGGEEVIISGQNFPRSGVQVRFGTKEATGVAVESDHAIKAYTPAGDKGTASDVSVVFDDGRAFVLKGAFHYVDSTQQRNTMDKFFDKAAGEKKPATP
jgi:hypothetical protein